LTQMAKSKQMRKEKIVPKKKKEESEEEEVDEEEEDDDEVLDLAGSGDEEEDMNEEEEGGDEGDDEEEEGEDEEEGGEDEEMEEGDEEEEGEQEAKDEEEEDHGLDLDKDGEEVIEKKRKGVLKTDVDPEAKQKKTGVIYFSTIPSRFTVTRMRAEMSKYASIGRIFLQQEKRRGTKGKTMKRYTEGWVEFHSKSLAKRVALTLNNNEVACNRRSAAAGTFWNCKYLPGFKWIHLNEQLIYERKMEKARMLSEIKQAKRVAEHFTEQIEKGHHLKRLEEKVLKKQGKWEAFQRQIKQRKIITAKKSKVREEKSMGVKTDDALMNMIFND
ncbi:hypothetical protein PFISCL1PPCAC_19420, partial [Pristionchus fissidentatus]